MKEKRQITKSNNFKQQARLLNSSGLLFLYLVGELDSNNGISVRHINTYCQPMKEFHNQVKIEKTKLIEEDFEIFCICGVSQKIDFISNIIKNGIKNNFKLLMEGKCLQKESSELDHMGNIFYCLVQEHIFSEHVRFPREFYRENDECVLYGVWAGKNPEDDSSLLAESALSIWMDNETPILMGKQLMINSFLLQDCIGRKVTNIIPNHTDGRWNLLLEGGLKVRLKADIPYLREKAGICDINRFTCGDIDSVLNNPIYAYGIFYAPKEIYEEWHKVFLFVAALIKENWNEESIVPIYEHFLAFLAENICETMPAELILEKEIYWKALTLNIKKIQGFLRGEDEVVISKDIFLLLNSRYAYLPYVYNLFQISNEIFIEKVQEFWSEELHRRIIASEINDVYKKGICWEQAVEYVIEHIKGLKVSGRRIRAGYQEIDLSVVNVSLDSRLWELGAYIMVECKNWKKQVGLPVIRNLAHISNMKGNKTTLLFSVNGVTLNAEKEIERLAVNGCFILCFNKHELINLKTAEECYNLLITKSRQLQEKIKDKLNI